MSQKFPHTEEQLTGMNVLVGAENLPPGQAPLIENVLPAPGRLGDVRAGFVGQLSGSGRIPLSPGPAWPPMSEAIRMPDGDPSRLLVTDPAGRLRYFEVGGTTVATIIEREGPGVALDDFALADGGEHCQVVQDGKYLYGIEGGDSGRLFRIDTEEATWQADLLISLPTPTIGEGYPRVGTDPTSRYQLEGTYRYRVRCINSDSDFYPPTGTDAREGKAVLASISVTAPEASLNVRTAKPYSHQLLIIDPADTSDFTHYVVERQGGIIAGVGDGANQWRVVAVFPFDTDTDSSDLDEAGVPDGWKWRPNLITPGEGVFTDYVPDVNLLVVDDALSGLAIGQGTVVTTGEDLPVGATCLALHAGRLWAAIGADIYYSRLLNSDYANLRDGLFWDTVPDLEDPLLPILGGTFTLGAEAQTRDRIKALAAVPADSSQEVLGAPLYAFREHSIVPISGFDGTNFRADTAIRAIGRGLMARRGIALVEGGGWLYQSPDGPMLFDGRSIKPLAEELTATNGADSLVTADGAIGSETGRGRIAYAWHRRRLWAFFPQDDDDLPSVAYVWQAITKGWVKVTCDSDITSGFVGGVVAAGATDTAQLYLFGNNGQIFLWDQSATTDKALSDSVSTEPIAWQITSRQFGQSEGRTRYAYKEQTPRALLIDLEAGTGGTTFSWAVTPPSAIPTSGAFTAPAGKLSQELTGLSDVRGVTHSVTLSGSATTTLRLGQFTLEVIKQGLRR